MLLNFFDLTISIDNPTCHSSSNPSCIDLTLTNGKMSFNFSKTFNVGLSYHNKLVSCYVDRTLWWNWWAAGWMQTVFCRRVDVFLRNIAKWTDKSVSPSTTDNKSHTGVNNILQYMCMHTQQDKNSIGIWCSLFAYGIFDKFKFCLLLGFHQIHQWY